METRFSTMLRCMGVICALALACVMLSRNAVAQVAPTTQFQLNGHAASDNLTCTYGTPCDYWNLVNGTGLPGGENNTGSAGHSSARTFINGTASTFSFTGGGSKDSNLLSSWSYSAGPTPNKDTFNHGYAAAYIASGDLVLVFGADRASTSGDANIGIWFFQDNVAPNGSGGFTGVHKNHDVFIVSAFTNGGSVPNFTVYEWNTACNKSNYQTPATLPGCAATNLNELYNATNVCGSNITCATTNQATIPTTWAGNLAAQAFYSGGVDISAVFRAAGVPQTPCFSSFLEETRSSQSTNAVLKDFLGGGFPVCGLTVSKTCGTAGADSSGTFANFPVSGTVTNTGVGTLYDVFVTDVITYTANSSHNTGTPLTLAVTNNTVGSPNNGTDTLGAGESGTWSTTLTSSATSVKDVATASGFVSSSHGATADVNSDPTNLITCGVEIQSDLKVTKSCTTTLVESGSDVQVKVNYSGTVCNTGASQITGITLLDYTGSSETAQSGGAGPTPGTTTLVPCTSVDPTTKTCLAPTAACTAYSGNYFPTTIDATAAAGRFFFNDLVVVSNATATIGTLNKVSSSDPKVNNTYGFASASCPICDKSECVQ